jgi:hypothetical protein
MFLNREFTLLERNNREQLSSTDQQREPEIPKSFSMIASPHTAKADMFRAHISTKQQYTTHLRRMAVGHSAAYAQRLPSLGVKVIQQRHPHYHNHLIVCPPAHWQHPWYPCRNA